MTKSCEVCLYKRIEFPAPAAFTIQQNFDTHSLGRTQYPQKSISTT
jgi:hypothetical protein